MRKSEDKFERNKNSNQGDLVCGRLNCLERSGVNPLVRRVMNTCFGSNFPGFIFATGLFSQFWFYRHKRIFTDNKD
ncbi:MAG: hypothetical protein ABIK53_02030 [bacterium]